MLYLFKLWKPDHQEEAVNSHKQAAAALAVSSHLQVNPLNHPSHSTFPSTLSHVAGILGFSNYQIVFFMIKRTTAFSMIKSLFHSKLTHLINSIVHYKLTHSIA